MKQKTTFVMINGDKHVLKMEGPTKPDLFKNVSFDKVGYFNIVTEAGRTIVLNPKYVVSIKIEES